MLFSCSDSPTVWSEGTITGRDGRYCGCCGGWFVDIGGQQFLMQQWPEKAKLQPDNLSLPVTVKLVWTRMEGSCPSNGIIVKRIREKS